MPEYSGIRYRTFDGVDYSFTFAWLPPHQEWRIYIDFEPAYGRRETGAHQSHRLGLGSRPYVCWTERLTTIDAAKQVAALWADATQHYIATGGFAAPPSRP